MSVLSDSSASSGERIMIATSQSRAEQKITWLSITSSRLAVDEEVNGNGGGETQSDRPGPLQVRQKRVLAPRVAHERDAGRAADTEHGPTHACRDRDQQPLGDIHVRI